MGTTVDPRKDDPEAGKLAERYRRFASREAAGHSACYQAWATGIADDPDLLGLIARLPGERQQPNLLLAAARFVGATPSPFGPFREWILGNWPAVREVAESRSTQTNEAGRCAVLLPVLAALPQPLALLEVGASAGLCLYPDRFSYQYDNRPVIGPSDGPAATLLTCTTTGPVPIPDRLPEIVWRAGIDLNPLDVRDEDAMRWLEMLVWPEQDARRQRLAAAIAVA